MCYLSKNVIMFKKLLIANRGEIACRIMATAQRMGISCVAIYSSADRTALHVQQADEAYWVGEAPSQASYLNLDAILTIAQRAGVDALHPGYGFLAENALLAKACEEQGIQFIGPSSRTLALMANKQAAKKLLQQHVPLIPGYHGADQSLISLTQAAKNIGFPLLIKAAAGGGGRGMRLVHRLEEFPEAIASAQREAQASFNDATLLLEKYLVNPRHIEVQIATDRYGNRVHLFERDCSIQRHHQKIIEEAPAAAVAASLKQRLYQTALTIARVVDYEGIGTLEFLVDPTNDQFYFLEMNTRIQVEHPVTELITGCDMVAWQLQIAAGHPLPCQQADIQAKGHALQVRLYAEDPTREFLPTTGTLHALQHPPQSPYVREDHSMQVGETLTSFYDSLLSKLIVWGADRAQAIQRLMHALAHWQLLGIQTNRDYLLAILRHPDFSTNQLGTQFLIQQHAHLIQPLKQPPLESALLAALGLLVQQTAQPIPAPWQLDSWQALLPAQQVLQLRHGEEMLELTITHHPQHYTCQVDGRHYSLAGTLHGSQLHAQINGQHIAALFVRHETTIYLSTHHYHACWQWLTQPFTEPVSTDKVTHYTAPLAGTLTQLLVNPPASVTQDQPVAIIEAMKMEHLIRAPQAGTLTLFHYTVGQHVASGARLFELE